MAQVTQSETERNARLDALQAATTQWGESRKRKLADQVTIAKTILRGRTGSDRLAEAAVSATSDLLAEQIDDFLAT